MTHRPKPQLEASLNGWNGQRKCDRSSPQAFLKSYLRRFPDRTKWIEINYGEAMDIITRLLA